MAYRDKRIPVRVDADEHADVHSAAAFEEVDASMWLRDLGEQRMKQLERKGWKRPSKSRRGR